MECCVEECGAKYGQVHVSFHRFPTSQTSRETLRRELWVEAAGLPNNKKIIDSALICGQHFENGKPSLPNEVRSPNWIPTLKLNKKSTVPPASTSVVIENKDKTLNAMNSTTTQQMHVPFASTMGLHNIPKDIHLAAYCRLCLAEDIPMVFPKKSNVYQQLSLKLKECLNVVISASELSYSLICKKCYETLEQFHQFRARCARQNTYLSMRKSLQPDRNRLLRYKENWYWYSCISNGMNSTIWGCSVVCCPAFVICHPSGKVCSKYANHQHKQKMEDVKTIYCNGEYVYDGYRYSFVTINPNRTLTFSCRSLQDPHKTCPALLITNDRSEVLSVTNMHDHQREVIIETAFKDGTCGSKRSITIIRGNAQELVFCQGYWYTTTSEQTNISHWKCIKKDCISTSTMVNGVVKFFGNHSHLPVLLKWGAAEEKTIEPKEPTLMRVVNPSSSNKLHPGRPNVPIKVPNTEVSVDSASNSALPVHSSSSLAMQPLVVSAAAMASQTAVSSKDVAQKNHPSPVVNQTNASRVRVVPPSILMKPKPPSAVPPKPLAPVSSSAVPKIVHVMSLNLNHSSNQPKPTELEADVGKSSAETESYNLKPAIKQEPADEPETITDDMPSAMIIPDNLPQPPPLTPKPMLAPTMKGSVLDSASMGDNYDGSSQETVSIKTEEEDCLKDLQEDEEIPPIVPIDADPDPTTVGIEFPPKILSNGKSPMTRKGSEKKRPIFPINYNPIEDIPLKKENMARKYGSSTGLQKRKSELLEPQQSNTKKSKIDEPVAPLVTAIVDTDNFTEPEGCEQMQNPAEDPIAVSTEPHQNVKSVAAGDQKDRPTDSAIKLVKAVNRPNVATVSKPPQQKAANSSPTPAFNRTEKKTHSKTVQLVKLQKTEQMLNFEGHLYKIKWHNRNQIYWDCMLREQVNCMAILETQAKNRQTFTKIGSHNHKVPKPIINDENRGRYQMLSTESCTVNTKNLPGQTVSIVDIEEQEGRIMLLSKRKIFPFKIRRADQNSLMTMTFANFEFEIRGEIGPGFRWNCTKCGCVLETDEKFTIAHEVGVTAHHHEPAVSVINLVEESETVLAETSKSSGQQSTPQSSSVEPNSDDENKKLTQMSQTNQSTVETVSDDLSDSRNIPTTSMSTTTNAAEEALLIDSSTDELKKTDALMEFASDDEEMVLDPSTGLMYKKGDLKRKENRKAILEDIVADDDDEDAEYLDPLSGKFRRKGDKSLSEDEPLEDTGNPEIDVSTSRPETFNSANEDFEELLTSQSIGSGEVKNPRRPMKNSLAALRQILSINKKLNIPDPERNFKVLPAVDDSTCLIRFNEFTYQLDTVLTSTSFWKCHLSPQYACRGKVQLSSDCKKISVSGVNHCHVPDLKDMFIDRPDKEEGQIKDSDDNNIRNYTFFKYPDHIYQLKLDDGYLYNCITVSKTGMSHWRCVFRQRSKCKAIITMEGDFESIARNRFSHSHGPSLSDEAAIEPGTAEDDDSEERDSSLDTPGTSTKRASRSETMEERKRKKRQTL